MKIKLHFDHMVQIADLMDLLPHPTSKVYRFALLLVIYEESSTKLLVYR